MLHDAKLAYEALSAPEFEIKTNKKPTKLEKIETDGFEKPTVKFSVQSKQNQGEYVLITGGYGQLMSHCPNYGCIAWITDKQGNIVHVWEIDPDEVWGEIEIVPGISNAKNIYPSGMNVRSNGDLIVTFQARNFYPFGVGTAKFNKDGELIWKLNNFSHHWFHVSDQNKIYMPVLKPIDSPLKVGDTKTQITCRAGQIYEDVIQIYDLDGVLIEEFSVTDSFLNSGYFGLVYFHHVSHKPSYENCDPTHLNGVHVLDKEKAGSFKDAQVGDILVSTRNNHTLAILDKETKKVKWLSSGLTLVQHSPYFGKDGRILSFDNLGGDSRFGGSRIVGIDPTDNTVTTLFPTVATPLDVNFYTHNSGHIDFHPNQTKALVALTRQGRVVEVDLLSGDVLWDYVNTHEIDKSLLKPVDSESENNIVFGRFATSGGYYVVNPKFEFNVPTL